MGNYPKNKRKPGQDFTEYFWSRVLVSTEEQCWPWTLSTTGPGYGHIRADGKMRDTHRVAWELANGTIPTGMCVLHKCDNRLCCNPAHLSLGSQAENLRDCVAKGRAAKAFGERSGAAKLDETKVRLVYLLVVEEGMTMKEAGTVVGVTGKNVQAIVSGRTWKHLGLRPQNRACKSPSSAGT